MPQSKVVIRINVDKESSPKNAVPAKPVVVWHWERIAMAGSIVIAVTVLLITFFYAQDEPAEQHSADRQALSPAPSGSGGGAAAVVPLPAKPVAGGVSAGEEAVVRFDRHLPAQNGGQVVNKGIIYDKKVFRASLNIVMKDNEPFEQAKLPLRLVGNQVVELFYFNEIRNEKNKLLFHNWRKDGKTVFMRQLKIQDSKAKVVSSLKLSYKDKGLWRIQLVDAKGKVYSEVNFLVYSE
ncbi:MAG: DUF2914 domain-containing protein [Methylococcales bacterium]|nr:DUF2914 domain-containing protein [Methylococcales bacterium]